MVIYYTFTLKINNYEVSKLIGSSILLVKRGSRESHEIQLLKHEVCKGSKTINVHVLMLSGDKTESHARIA